MAAVQTIESRDMTLGDMFNDFYVVPDYQREYIWEDEQVERLLQDIHDEFTGANGSASEYFVGSIVVCPRDGKVLELIDGQQRLTTAYLFLCALRDHLKDVKDETSWMLDQQIATIDMDVNGRDVFRYRIDLQYEDSGDILETIADGTYTAAGSQAKTRSIENIENAYAVIRAFLKREFGDDTDAARRFYAFVSLKVKLIRIQTQSVAHALKIFETINDRGKGLDSMDLLKNLMFMEASQADYEQLQDKWKDLVDTLYRIGEKPLRFLRYYVFATYSVEDRLREDGLYDWFVRNRDLCGYKKNPLRFVDGLLDAVRAYANFLAGQGLHGEPNRYLANIKVLSGAARQHLILLLAARHLPPDSFADLCRHVENLFFVYVITREPTRDFETRFAQWSGELRRVRSGSDLDAFVDRRFEPAKLELSSRFDLAFSGLTEFSIQKFRLRYLLGKLTQYVNENAYGSEGAAASLATFVNIKVDIEHILPQSPSDEALKEFDQGDHLFDFIYRLGNLVLIEKPLNSSLGNKPFSEKRLVYANSTFLLTSSIGKKTKVGQDTSVDRAVRTLQPYETWESEDIVHRQQTLRALAREVWEVSAIAGTSS